MTFMWHRAPHKERWPRDPAAGPGYAQAMPSLLRHIQVCNNTTLPGGRLRLDLAEQAIGWVSPTLVDPVVALGVRRTAAGLTLDDPAALPALGRGLAERGLCKWRDEAFDVRDATGAVVAQIDRGALPLLGVRAEGVHLNGLVARPDGLHVWLGRRAADKLLDPGKLDHIVAGGIPAGLDPAQTLVKEAAEEAGLPGSLVASARYHGAIAYTMQRPEGLRRDLLHCYDLLIPEHVIPHPVDGEVAGFELWPIAAVLEAVRQTDDFKFNVNLVLIDLFLRQGLIPEPEASQLRAALAAGN
jgi:8-oxo-dGTP pyrophosphatase MutT (NUDIX family)